LKKKRLKNKGNFLTSKLTRKQYEKDVRKATREIIEIIKREDNLLPSPEYVLAIIRHREEKAPDVKCGNCGYSWKPNPYRWKDEPEKLKFNLQKYKGELVRPIVCPKCNTLNMLDMGTLFLIVKWWSMHKIESDVLKEEAARAREIYKTQMEAIKG
jgi:hypothetical protein